MGARIAEAKKTYSYIDDEIVIDIVTKTIKQFEKEKKNWIIEGYPRTREQALSLTKMDFIPDRMILLEVADKLTEERVIENLKKEDAHKVTKDPAEIAKAVVQEYKTHIDGVKDIYSGNIAVIDGNKRQDVVLQEIARILKFKQVNAPKTCPKILLIGLPGSGKTTQARMLAEKLKVIHVEVNSIIKDVIRNGTDESKHLWKLLKEGDPIPDEIYENLISERLSQLDCRMNGFVLDGYPLTNDQMRFLLENCNIKPSHVISLDINDHRAYERLEYRKYDPVSGIYFNVYTDPPKDEEILKRLIQAPEDEHHVVKKIIMGLRKNLDIEDKIIINADNDPLSVHNDIMTEIGM